MEIITTKLGAKIVTEAEKLLTKNCLEKTGNNDGDCIRSIVESYSMRYGDNKLKPGKSQLPYCAMTASEIVGRAFEKLGEENPLWSAGATSLLQKARQLGIKVDNKPKAGCIMLSKSSSPSGLHAGIVWYVNGDKVGTIEGNTSGYLIKPDDRCLYKAKQDGVVTKERKIKEIAYFIHIEDFYGKDDVATLELVHSGLRGEGLADESDICVFRWNPDDTHYEDSPDDFIDESGKEKFNYQPYAYGALAIIGCLILWKVLK